MSAVTPAPWKRWANPAPVVKQLVTMGGFAIAMALTAVLPDLGFPNSRSLLIAVALLVIATALSAAVSVRAWHWRFEGVVWAIDVFAVFFLRTASDVHFSPLFFLPVLLVIPFAGRRGIQNVAYAVLGSFLTLVVPVLIWDFEPTDLAIGSFATLVVAIVGFVFYAITDSQRTGIEQLADHASKLERSERDRATAQRTLQGVWEAVTEQVIIATDFSGRIVSWNPGAEKMLGMSRHEVEHQRDILDFHLPSEIDGFHSLVESANRGIARAGEWTYLRGDGSSFPVQLTVTPRSDELGNTTGYLFVAIDMTEARAVAKLKDDFVGLISHELRTPLSSILGYLELLRDDDDVELSEAQLQYLSVAERNAHRLLRLVGDLLFTAQVESGTFSMEQRRIDLAEIVEASLETARPAAAAAGVTLASSFAAGAVVDGDAVRLSQAIDNLVSNAIKFTPGGGTVTVALDVSASEAVVEVQDTGMGIAASEMDKLFSRFFRATTATRNAVPGVGLGLTITKAIVTAHHGQMFVESEEGVGTSFSLSLPLARVAAPVPA